MGQAAWIRLDWLIGWLIGMANNDRPNDFDMSQGCVKRQMDGHPDDDKGIASHSKKLEAGDFG